MTHTVYLGLGANLGDRLANMRAAQAGMPPQARVINASPVYETPPWGYSDQPDFLNQALQIETNLSPEALLAFLKGLEKKLGRVPTFRNAPRPIDIDILFYDDLVLSQEGLEIPHPRLENRAFVLVPLADIAPELYHPVLGLTISELLSRIDASEVVVFKATDETGTNVK